jgi:hypothetical protein
MNLGENNEYATFAFYDKQHRRLSIFGQDNLNGSMLITIIVCAKGDKFSRKAGRDLFKQEKLRREVGVPYEKKPLAFSIPLKDGDRPNWSFIEFCKSRFKRRFTKQVIRHKSYFI